MAKKKKFEHRAPRPTLAASLEAVRQGQPIAVTEKPLETPASPVITTVPVAAASGAIAESRYVKAEILRIGLIMAVLLGLLVTLATIEVRSGLLTKTVERLLRISA